MVRKWFSTQHCMKTIGANKMLTLYTPDVSHTITQKKQDFKTNATLTSLKKTDPKHCLIKEKRSCALSEKIIEMCVFMGENGRRIRWIIM